VSTSSSEPTREQLEALAVHQERRIQELEAASAQRTLDAEIGTAIAASGVSILPGTESQVLDLLRPTVQSYTDGAGRRIHAGPNFTDLKTHVMGAFKTNLAHFVAGPPQAAPASGAGLAPPPGPPPASDGRNAKDWLDHFVAQSAHKLSVDTDPRTNLARGMVRGLKGS
jgi:hypothetical protein